MIIAWQAFGVAFAAVCIWLAVRIVNRRERWAKWTLAVVVTVPVLYVASFGPVCWWISRYGDSEWLPDVYRPVGSCGAHWPMAKQIICGYARMGMPPESEVYLPSQLGFGFRINHSRTIVGPPGIPSSPNRGAAAGQREL
jgi:hypothetical protein